MLVVGDATVDAGGNYIVLVALQIDAIIVKLSVPRCFEREVDSAVVLHVKFVESRIKSVLAVRAKAPVDDVEFRQVHLLGDVLLVVNVDADSRRVLVITAPAIEVGLSVFATLPDAPLEFAHATPDGAIMREIGTDRVDDVVVHQSAGIVSVTSQRLRQIQRTYLRVGVVKGRAGQSNERNQTY